MFREAKIQRMLTQDGVSEADAYYLNKDTSKRGTRGGDGEWKRRICKNKVWMEMPQ